MQPGSNTRHGSLPRSNATNKTLPTTSIVLGLYKQQEMTRNLPVRIRQEQTPQLQCHRLDSGSGWNDHEQTVIAQVATSSETLGDTNGPPTQLKICPEPCASHTRIFCCNCVGCLLPCGICTCRLAYYHEIARGTVLDATLGRGLWCIGSSSLSTPDMSP